MGGSSNPVIAKVVPDSIAFELGLEPGDEIISINGHRITDLIDYRFYTSDDFLEIEVLKRNGEEWVLEIEKEPSEDLGISFAEAVFDRMRTCRNKCIFCFVDQMPPHQRESLYIKDDDYRLSFLQGNFITLTNLSDADLERIAAMRLSPLYVSVHTTDSDLRIKMLRNKRAGQIMSQLRYLTSHGISVHAQVVLCPGVNDGEFLEKTIDDLAGLWPGVASLAVVPVGLTGFREGLVNIKLFDSTRARKLIHDIKPLQQHFRSRLGYTFVFLADEFYLQASIPFPAREEYEDFPQTENGVGLARLFLDEFAWLRTKLPDFIDPPRRIAAVTGVSGGKVLAPVARELNAIQGLDFSLIPVENHFFGPSVTVTGLVSGQDIVRTLHGQSSLTEILIPTVMLRSGEEVFLDGMTVAQLERELSLKMTLTEPTAADMIAKALGKRLELDRRDFVG